MELIQQWGLGWKHHLFQTMVTWQPLERSSLYQALAWAVVSHLVHSYLSDSRNVGTVPGPGGASEVTPRYREERVPLACAQAKEI